jgi:hypothetical protein
MGGVYGTADPSSLMQIKKQRINPAISGVKNCWVAHVLGPTT